MDGCRCTHDATKDKDTRLLVHVDEVARAAGLFRQTKSQAGLASMAIEFRARYIRTGILQEVVVDGRRYINRGQAERVLGRSINFWE